MDRKRLASQMQFLIEADKMKSVLRMTLLADGSRRENDAEHSWHLALMAMTLAEYAAEDIDISRVIRMALLHDIIEIYAGDTFAYDEKGYEDKAQREAAAADRIFAILPEEQAKFDDLPEEFSHLYLAIDRQLAAVIIIEDPLREEAAEAVQELHNAGFQKIVMMTGDSERTAASIAKRVGVDEYYAEVLPEDKASFIRREQERRHQRFAGTVRCRYRYGDQRRRGNCP